MATLVAKAAFDIKDVNFQKLAKGTNLKYSSSVVSVDYYSSRDKFRGSFNVNVEERKITGTATSWTHFNWQTGALRWEFTGIRLSASKAFAAAKTATLTDDYTLVRTMLAKDDNFVGSKLADRMSGYDGNDTFTSGVGADTLDGGAGTRDRAVYAAYAADLSLTLKGGNVATLKIGSQSSDLLKNIEDITAGSGDDRIVGDSASNRLSGNNGRDSLSGNGGNDTLDGGGGRDALSGGVGNDSLSGGSDKDTLDGGTGYDTVRGGSSDDLITGGEGNDKLYGDTGNDTIAGNLGRDWIEGGDGSDVIMAGSSNDTVYGGAGKDTIGGGPGRDILYGGADADVFRYVSTGESPKGATTQDFIKDFQPKLDRIDLSLLDAKASVGSNQAFIYDGKGTSTTSVAEGHISWYQSNKAGTANDRTYVRINVDSDAATELNIELKGLLKLSSTDFIL